MASLSLSLMRRAAVIVLCVALSPLSRAQRFRFAPVSESVLVGREQNAPVNQADRAERLKQLFRQAGCEAPQLTEQALANGAGANVICLLPGKSKEAIIVGASYGQAALDNWSGACSLPSLLQSLKNRRRRHTFIFVAFADGAGDLAGSRFFAARMSPQDQDQTEAMINLAALGFSPTKISSRDSDKNLVESLVTVMYVLRQMGSQVDISQNAPIDSEPFASMHIPQITIHSLTRDALAGLESQGAQSPAPDREFAHVQAGFRLDHYYDSYRLICGYLAYLDITLKPRRRK